MLELDNKTLDLKVSISALAGDSPYEIFNSGPRKIVNALHFYYLDNKKVLGVRPPVTEEVEHAGLGGWINILEASYIKDSYGNRLIEDNNLTSNIKTYVFDLDAVSSYPSDTIAANVSKDTTRKELLSIDGMELEDYRLKNINIFFGNVNSIDYCTSMFNFPTIEEILQETSK